MLFCGQFEPALDFNGDSIDVLHFSNIKFYGDVIAIDPINMFIKTKNQALTMKITKPGKNKTDLSMLFISKQFIHSISIHAKADDSRIEVPR